MRKSRISISSWRFYLFDRLNCALLHNERWHQVTVDAHCVHDAGYVHDADCARHDCDARRAHDDDCVRRGCDAHHAHGFHDVHF